jgi:NAD(P)-dependent dehydrogenase (short-subunit alcohol dehydrogenase family)
MSLPAVLRRAARAPALVRARPRFSRLASTFVPCGEGFAPDATATRAFSSSDARAGGRVSDCAKTVVLADAGHGVGRALLASLLAYPDCRLTVAAATPSADLVASLRNQHWPECEALQCEVSRVDLGDDADVARWRERVLFTHGTPDVVIANVGCMPSRWLRAYGESPSGDGARLGANGRLDRFAAWRVRAADWSRLMNDVKGVGNVARQFLPAMVQATREEAFANEKEAFANEKETKREIENEARHPRAFARSASEKTREKKKTRGTRAFVVVSHVVDPPAGATLAPYEASRAALAAVTRALAADLRNVASELDETSRASRNENKNKHANVSEDVSLPYPYGGVVAALVDPGRIPGLALERDGADVGPLHKTHGDARAADWARAAVPFILQMTHEVAGETTHVPGFR